MKARDMFSWSCAYALALGTAVGTKAQNANPPMLVASVPANNETNVPVNNALSFTFNEAMSTGHSVDWGGSADVPDHSWYWSQDQRTIICLFSAPLPPNTLITWELNPPEYSLAFRNLAGTPLPSGLYQGSFSTGTNAAQLQIQPIGWSAPQQFHLRVVGAAGKQVVVYGSTDFTNWIPWGTNGPAIDPIEFTNSLSPFLPCRFYRAAVISSPP